MKFQELISRCKRCKACRLRESATQVVPGEGDSHADIMFIGEGPGVNEDKQGIPFCGAAGKFLDELLHSIEIKRKDVYIANIVKCRPPGNRDPRDDEIRKCRPWLDAQIKFIKPKVFVLLGRFAMGKFFPNLKISKVHGRSYQKEGKVYFILYHPAVALYNSNYREVFFGDMKKLKAILDKNGSGVDQLDSSRNEISELLKKNRESKKQKKQIRLSF